MEAPFTLRRVCVVVHYTRDDEDSPWELVRFESYVNTAMGSAVRRFKQKWDVTLSTYFGEAHILNKLEAYYKLFPEDYMPSRYFTSEDEFEQDD